jgi:hypothetical protein
MTVDCLGPESLTSRRVLLSLFVSTSSIMRSAIFLHPISFYHLIPTQENSGYLIRTMHGATESFEKEYYDLICSAFLKYRFVQIFSQRRVTHILIGSFQARIGNMDGVIVAYHNTARIFGFQYISLAEIDERLFGHIGRGQPVFEKCVRLLETVVEEIIQIFPDQVSPW